jgi:hypothetical protein
MIDRLFTAALAFTLLVGATVAVANAWFDSRTTTQVVRLPQVTVVVERAPARIDLARTDLAGSQEGQPASVQ